MKSIILALFSGTILTALLVLLWYRHRINRLVRSRQLGVPLDMSENVVTKPAINKHNKPSKENVKDEAQ